MAAPFFLSYASNDDRVQESDPFFSDFVRDLNVRVRHRMTEDGYWEPRDLRPGQIWCDESVHALSTSSTLVAMYSPSYFRSEPCGREFQIFLDRRRRYMDEHVGKHPANIIPVLWHPTQIPLPVPNFKPQGPESLDNKKSGVWDLCEAAKLDPKKKEELVRVLNSIADRIREAHDTTPLPPLSQAAAFFGVQSAFDPPPLPLVDFDHPGACAGPQCVTFVYQNMPAWSTWPYAPPQRQAVLSISASAATGLEYSSHQLAFDVRRADLIPRLRLAQERNNIILMIVDGTSLAHEVVRGQVQEYDSQRIETISTLIVWPETGAYNSALVQSAFPNSITRSAPYFYPDISGPEQFGKAVSASIDRLKNEILKHPHNPNFLPRTSEFPTIPMAQGPGQSGEDA